VDAPVAHSNGQGLGVNGAGDLEPQDLPPAGEAAHITPDQARALKVLAQTAFGYAEGERRLRADLGFEVEERTTLRHLAAHVSVEQYQALVDEYTAHLQAKGEADVP
jgi:hypothetical protein